MNYDIIVVYIAIFIYDKGIFPKLYQFNTHRIPSNSKSSIIAA